MLLLWFIQLGWVSVNTVSFISQKAYTALWDRIKDKSYSIPHDSNALVHAKQQKALLSKVSTFLHSFTSVQNEKHCSGCSCWINDHFFQVKYKEDYEKFKSLYSLPKCLEDDPATARCIKAGKLNLDVCVIFRYVCVIYDITTIIINF